MHMVPQLHSPQRYGNDCRICRTNYFTANRYGDRPQFSSQIGVMPCPGAEDEALLGGWAGIIKQRGNSRPLTRQFDKTRMRL